MEATTHATPQVDPRDKKKYYFADTPRRRALVAVTGSDKFFGRFPRRARVRVEFLPPLAPKPGENPLALTDRLMFTLAQSLPEEMRGVYARMPEGFAMQI